MEPSFLGGILTRQAAEQRRLVGVPAGIVDETWGWVGETAELFLREAPACCQVFTWDSLVLLIRGVARPAGSGGGLDLERVAEELRCHYLEQGRLAVDDLDGSFSLALLDGNAQRVLLYRSLVGAGFTYYHASPEGLLFGGSLAELTRSAGLPLRPGHQVLPAFFLFRLPPGEETLFEGFHRLLPGEQLCWEAGRCHKVQRGTWAGLRQEEPPGDPVDHLEQTLEQVLRDGLALRPRMANLLSGGVDSSYLQALFAPLSDELMPPSFSVCVDHPDTWQDTDYAVQAADQLGARHTLIPADGSFADYLLETVAATAEPPNHVQTAYFGHLARGVAARGVQACFTAVGADSLFGLDLARLLHDAGRIRRLPTRLLRGTLAHIARLLGKQHWARASWLADHLHAFDHPHHPVSQTAVFSDLATVEHLFGRTGMARAFGKRQEMLDHLRVPAAAQDRLHGACYFGMAAHTASLWTALFNQAGLDLFSPFFDSRVVRLAASLPVETRICPARPKELLRQALCRHLPHEQVHRRKLGFGQPVFEWLAPGGVLRPLVEQIDRHDFLDHNTLQAIKARPTWVLWSLLCYDLWHKLFISRTLSAPSGTSRPHDATRPAPSLAAIDHG